MDEIFAMTAIVAVMMIGIGIDVTGTVEIARTDSLIEIDATGAEENSMISVVTIQAGIPMLVTAILETIAIARIDMETEIGATAKIETEMIGVIEIEEAPRVVEAMVGQEAEGQEAEK